MNHWAVPGADAGLRAALSAEDLPVDDLEEKGRSFFAFGARGDPVAYGGYELAGGDALLRSIVVVAAARGRGHGRAIAEILLERAAAAGAGHAYLLTNSTAPFFLHLGFETVARSKAPAAILATREAASLCPSTAALLARPLGSRRK